MTEVTAPHVLLRDRSDAWEFLRRFDAAGGSCGYPSLGANAAGFYTVQYREDQRSLAMDIRDALMAEAAGRAAAAAASALGKRHACEPCCDSPDVRDVQCNHADECRCNDAGIECLNCDASCGCEQ